MAQIVADGHGHCVSPRDARIAGGYGATISGEVYVANNLSAYNTRYVAAHEFGHRVAYVSCGFQCQIYIMGVIDGPWTPKGTTGSAYYNSGAERWGNAWARCHGYGSAPSYGYLSCDAIKTALTK